MRAIIKSRPIFRAALLLFAPVPEEDGARIGAIAQ